MSKLPKFPNSYQAEAAKEYDSTQWMERNQKLTTFKLIQYLQDPNLGAPLKIKGDFSQFILDLGCGTGFSSEVIRENGFKVVGIEILWDMLSVAKEKFPSMNREHLHFILADINNIPLRENTIDHVLSVSAYNFIIHELRNNKIIEQTLKNTAQQINNVLKSDGRVIIEFYPNSEKELDLFTISFIEKGFQGFKIKKNPHQKAGQTFLLLKKKE